MKKSTFRSTALFILLVTLVPAALVYIAATLHAERQWRLGEESLGQDARAAIEYVVKVNELRLKMPGKTPQELAAIVFPPLPSGYTLRTVTAAERAAHPEFLDSDYLVQQSGPPHLVIPGDAPPLHLDLSAATTTSTSAPNSAPMPSPAASPAPAK